VLAFVSNISRCPQFLEDKLELKREDFNFNEITQTSFDDKPCICIQYLPLEGELKREDRV